MKRVLVLYLQDIANIVKIEMPSFHSLWEWGCFLFILRENWDAFFSFLRENWDAFFSSFVRIEMPSFHPWWELRCLLFILGENWDAFFSSFVKIEMPSFHPQREIMKFSSKHWRDVESLGQWKSKVVGYLVLTKRSLMKWNGRFWVMTW
jgi:hypothetical protein